MPALQVRENLFVEYECFQYWEKQTTERESFNFSSAKTSDKRILFWSLKTSIVFHKHCDQSYRASHSLHNFFWSACVSWRLGATNFCIWITFAFALVLHTLQTLQPINFLQHDSMFWVGGAPLNWRGQSDPTKLKYTKPLTSQLIFKTKFIGCSCLLIILSTYSKKRR